jgi:hypothetical protein
MKISSVDQIKKWEVANTVNERIESHQFWQLKPHLPPESDRFPPESDFSGTIQDFEACTISHQNQIVCLQSPRQVFNRDISYEVHVWAIKCPV